MQYIYSVTLQVVIFMGASRCRHKFETDIKLEMVANM